MSTWQFAQADSWQSRWASRWRGGRQDPQGIYFGGNEMLMTPRSRWCSFGELYLDDGMASAIARSYPKDVDERTRITPSGDRAGAAIANTATDSGFASSATTTVVLRVGLRRAVHLHRPQQRPRHRHDVTSRRIARAAGSSRSDLRPRGRDRPQILIHGLRGFHGLKAARPASGLRPHRRKPGSARRRGSASV